jgi:hypothetical protein
VNSTESDFSCSVRAARSASEDCAGADAAGTTDGVAVVGTTTSALAILAAFGLDAFAGAGAGAGAAAATGAAGASFFVVFAIFVFVLAAETEADISNALI